MSSVSFYRFGIIGYPLGHSLSPRLHQAALRSAGLQGEYRTYPIRPLPEGEADLDRLLARMRSGELHGLNVTIPHKQAVMPKLDEMTGTALAIGAVNTIIPNGDRLLGDNTDAPGFMRALQQAFPEKTSQKERVHTHWEDCHRYLALVLGAGGAARAVVYALIQAGWEVIITARRLEQADELCAHFLTQVPAINNPSLSPLGSELQPGGIAGDKPAQITCFPLSALEERVKALPGIDLIVNTTPLGMAPSVEMSPWLPDIPFPKQAVLYDLIYNPKETCLIKQARMAGLQAESGMGMLVEQAALAFERWTGLRGIRQSMQESVLSLS